MHRAWAVVAMLVVLVSGCNGFPGGSEPTIEETVTPVPIPDEGSTATPSDGRCLAPPPAVPSSVGQRTPVVTDTWPINDTVFGTALIERHDAVLPEQDYTLRAGEQRRVWSLHNHSAFAYTSGDDNNSAITAYAVGGRLYERYNFSADKATLIRGSYEPSRDPGGQFISSLTGADWLTGIIGTYPYELQGTTTYRGTEVRVLNTTVLAATFVGDKYMLAINSTVYVDRRGVIRYVHHYERYNWQPTASEEAIRVINTTFEVDDLQPADIQRPSSLCGIDPGSVTIVNRTAPYRSDTPTAEPTG